jgi:ADP-heptose:LPS heptosyltransferase
VRVLLLRAGALGDLLLLRPTLAALRAASHAVTLIAPASPAAPLLREVDELFPWERPELAALLAGDPVGALGERLARSDAVLAFTRSDALCRALAAASATPVRAHAPDPPPGRHAAEWLRQAVRDWAGAEPPPVTTLRPSPDEAKAAEALVSGLPGGFLAVHPGSGSPAKNWPSERFETLLARLSLGRRFLLVRGEADATACAPLAQHPGAVLASELPLRVLGAALARSGLFVGNDSGVSHLAAAYGAPTLALFGPTDSRSWCPLGAHASALRSESGAMEGLEVEDVVAAARTLLAKSARALPSG